MSETELNIQIKPDQKNDTTISFAAPINPLPDRRYPSAAG
jgi:hypothetical protein